MNYKCMRHNSKKEKKKSILILNKTETAVNKKKRTDERDKT